MAALKNVLLIFAMLFVVEAANAQQQKQKSKPAPLTGIDKKSQKDLDKTFNRKQAHSKKHHGHKVKH